MHRRWISWPLFSTCVLAFYPYNGDGNGSDDKEKRFFPIRPGGDGDTDGSGVYTLDVRKLPKRDNTFPVVTSTQPSAPNAMAINQDGSDYSYFSTMKFGSKEQDLYMLIDTGSANTWVMGADCKSDACTIHNTFGATDSKTLNVTKQPWSLSYGTGQVQGVMASDTVSFANYTIELGFGMATTASDDFNNYPMDGILGLGPTASEELTTPTVMQVLDKQAGLAQNVIGIHLQRAADNSNDGQIVFGGYDASKFSGQLKYTPKEDGGSWEIAADDASVNGKPCKFTGKSAIIDTGTSYILMPPNDAQVLHDLIPGSSRNGEGFLVPCDATAQVQFVFSGTSYSVSPRDYVGKASGNACASNIIGHQAFGPNQWILGDVFLKNVYTVFDFDKSRIGFGTKSSAAAQTTSTSLSSTTALSSSGVASTASVAPLTPAPTSMTTGTSSSITTSAGPKSTSTDSSPFGGDSANNTNSASKQSLDLYYLLAFTWSASSAGLLLW